MKNLTPILAGIVGIITLVLQSPAVQTWVGGLLTGHPGLAAVLGGLATILALFHVPTTTKTP